MKNAKIQKKKYNDIKKLFGKEYFKSYFIKPKVHLSLSPSSERFSAGNKKNEIISNINSSKDLTIKNNRNSQIIKIPNYKSNNNYFKLTKETNQNFKKIKILIKSLINKSTINLRTNNDMSAYNNYISASQRSQNLENKKNNENIIYLSNNSNNEYIYHKNINNFKQKQIDMKIKSSNIKSSNNKIYKNNNKLFLCDSLFRIDRSNKIIQKNFKNKNKTFIKNQKSKKLLEFKLKKNNNENKKNNLIKKIKLNNIVNNQNINKNKSYQYLIKNKPLITKFENNNNNLGGKNNYLLPKKINNSQSLYSQIFQKRKESEFPCFTEHNIKINNKENKKSNINNYCFKNKSIDINSNRSFKKRFFNILKEQRKKLREEEIKKNMEEIKFNSNLRKQKYIKLFNIINNSFSEIKKLIEQIEKEDLLKDITAKINDDKSYDSILNNENSITIEHTLQSILTNGLYFGKNNNSNENSIIINNDFSFEENKKDILLKSINIKNNSIFENHNSNLNSNFEENKNKENCFIF